MFDKASNHGLEISQGHVPAMTNSGRLSVLHHAAMRIGLGAVALTLSACSLNMKEPAFGATYRTPASVPVVVMANATMSNLTVRDITPNGTTDVTSQMSAITDNQRSGTLTGLSLGKHTIEAEADVYCWYCSRQTHRSIVSKNICVAEASWSPSYPSFTAVGKSNSQTWNKTSDTTVGVSADTGARTERWNLIRVGGITQTVGLIQSTENSCLCMRSTDTPQNTPIGLALCDSSDHTQLWQALELPATQGFSRFQNMGRAVSDACLTQGPNNTLVQRACQDTGDQLWKIKDKNGAFVRPFF